MNPCCAPCPFSRGRSTGVARSLANRVLFYIHCICVTYDKISTSSSPDLYFTKCTKTSFWPGLCPGPRLRRSPYPIVGSALPLSTLELGASVLSSSYPTEIPGYVSGRFCTQSPVKSCSRCSTYHTVRGTVAG